mgnify:CR=1 FL=1
MVTLKDKPRCDGTNRGSAATVALPVLPSHAAPVRKSRTSRWRALSLIAVHLLIIGHVLHWVITGRTVSPVEPSETMYTLNNGELTIRTYALAPGYYMVLGADSGLGPSQPVARHIRVGIGLKEVKLKNSKNLFYMIVPEPGGHAAKL